MTHNNVDRDQVNICQVHGNRYMPALLFLFDTMATNNTFVEMMQIYQLQDFVWCLMVYSINMGCHDEQIFGWCHLKKVKQLFQ